MKNSTLWRMIKEKWIMSSTCLKSSSMAIYTVRFWNWIKILFFLPIRRVEVIVMCSLENKSCLWTNELNNFFYIYLNIIFTYLFIKNWRQGKNLFGIIKKSHPASNMGILYLSPCLNENLWLIEISFTSLPGIFPLIEVPKNISVIELIL